MTLMGMTSKNIKNKWWFAVLAVTIFLILVVCNDKSLLQSPVTLKNSNSSTTLPILRVSIDSTTKQARRQSSILAELPSGFDEWQHAYLNIPVNFVFVDEDIEISIPQTHTFTVAPYKGYIRGLSVIVAPLFPSNLEGAVKETKKWLRYFDSLGLEEDTDSKILNKNLTIEDVYKTFKESRVKNYARYGLSAGRWQSNQAFYSVGID